MRLVPVLTAMLLSAACTTNGADTSGQTSSSLPPPTSISSTTPAAPSSVTSTSAPSSEEPPRFVAPDQGFLTVDNQEITVFDVEGNRLAEWASPKLFMSDETLPAVVINHTDGTAYSIDRAGISEVDEVAYAYSCQPGFTVCRDRSAGFELLITPDGKAVRTPYEIPTGVRIPGFWRYVIPGDGYALGQYSAECEVPSVAAVDAGGSLLWHIENATALGFGGTDALIRTADGGCGDAELDPGVYRVTIGGIPHLLAAGTFGSAAGWDLRPTSCRYVGFDPALTPGLGTVGRFDRTGRETVASTATGEDRSWLVVDDAPARLLNEFGDGEFADARRFNIEWVADFTGEGIDELVVDPGLGNDQRLYVVRLTACSGELLARPSGEPFFFEVAAGPTYEVGYTCWGTTEDFEGIITIESTGPRDEDGRIEDVVLTGWRYDRGVMQQVALTAASPVTFDCPGRE